MALQVSGRPFLNRVWYNCICWFWRAIRVSSLRPKKENTSRFEVYAVHAIHCLRCDELLQRINSIHRQNVPVMASTSRAKTSPNPLAKPFPFGLPTRAERDFLAQPGKRATAAHVLTRHQISLVYQLQKEYWPGNSPNLAGAVPSCRIKRHPSVCRSIPF